VTFLTNATNKIIKRIMWETMLSWKICKKFKNIFENLKPHIDTDFGLIAFLTLFLKKEMEICRLKPQM
jgi:hypothetical protein